MAALALAGGPGLSTPTRAQQPTSSSSWSTSAPLRTTIPDQPVGKQHYRGAEGHAAAPQAAPAAPIPAGIGQISLTAL
jgi:hypothetical protein